MLDMSTLHGKPIDVEIEMLENKLKEFSDAEYFINPVRRMIFNTYLEKLIRLQLICAFAKTEAAFSAYRDNVNNLYKD